jgi:glycosyltransferase involved in cell wall biosynthesis
MLKILVISTVGLGLYGITNSIMNYYRAMDKNDMQIDFLTPNEIPEHLKKEIKSNGGNIYEGITRNSNVLNYMKQLSKIIKKGKYDIVHAHGNSRTLAIEMLAAKMCRVKVRISHCHNSTCDHKSAHKLLRPIFNNSYTHGFACSNIAGRWLYGNRPFTVINNGIPVSNFIYNEKDRMELRQKLNFASNKVIGHIGHMSFQKNQEFLIKIFAEIYKKDSSYRLLLIGDGDLRDALQKQIEEYGLNPAVCLYGETTEVSKLLQAMDVFVFPSRFEGFGMVVIEAQAAGLPCVVSEAVPSEAKLTEEVSFVSLDASIETWINKIMEASLSDRAVRSEVNNRLVQNSDYNIKNEAGKLKKLYNDYMSERNR